jgi:hypothetical protein
VETVPKKLRPTQERKIETISKYQTTKEIHDGDGKKCYKYLECHRMHTYAKMLDN